MIQLNKNIQKEEIPGTVYLVGAGPGDPDLISVRGARLLQQADALVYDRLVHPDLVNGTPAKTEKIYVGKAAGHKSIPQEVINALLVDLAKKYRTVVRLKGGDPFVYGRGSEEALELKNAGISFEVVPGISSAVAVPAYAGIPLTHRGLARSFTVITGHTATGASDIDWASYVNTDTLVILMGLRRLPVIVDMLVQHGKASDTPVAVISRGSTAEQKTVVGSLADIAECARDLPTPAIIVIGPVVDFHYELDWHSTLREKKLQAASVFSSVFTEHIYAVSA